MDKQRERQLRNGYAQRERLAARAAFPLPDRELEAMFAAIQERLDGTPCDTTLRHTTAWLRGRGHEVESIVPWLRENGGYCDCEVLMNVEDHWLENRENP